MSSNIEKVLKTSAVLTALLAAVGWAGRKAFGKTLTPNPSQSGEAFFTFFVTVAGCGIVVRWLLDELEKT